MTETQEMSLTVFDPMKVDRLQREKGIAEKAEREKLAAIEAEKAKAAKAEAGRVAEEKRKEQCEEVQRKETERKIRIKRHQATVQHAIVKDLKTALGDFFTAEQLVDFVSDPDANNQDHRLSINY